MSVELDVAAVCHAQFASTWVHFSGHSLPYVERTPGLLSHSCRCRLRVGAAHKRPEAQQSRTHCRGRGSVTRNLLRVRDGRSRMQAVRCPRYEVCTYCLL